MFPKKASSAGGKARAKQQRDEALKKYYESPNRCKQCDKVIEVQEGQKVAEVRHKKFCNRSCAATYNNKNGAPKRVAKTTSTCKNCGGTIYLKRGANGWFTPRRRCDTCHTLKIIQEKGKAKLFAESKSKASLLSKGWQCARSQIAKHARRVFARTGRSLRCEYPGCIYSHYAEVCHRRPVADFPGSATIKEINMPANLVALCPNHHWDLDHGIQ